MLSFGCDVARIDPLVRGVLSMKTALAFGVGILSGIVLAVGLGWFQPSDQPHPSHNPRVDPQSPPRRPERTGFRFPFAEQSDRPSKQLAHCQQQLIKQWLEASHPVDVANPDTACESARKFIQLFWANDNPDQLRDAPTGDAMRDLVQPLLHELGVEIEKITFDCDEYPCTFDIVLSESAGRLTTDSLDEDWEDRFTDHLQQGLSTIYGDELFLSGPHIHHVSSGDDGGTNHIDFSVSTHSEDDFDELSESLGDFFNAVLGIKIYDYDW